MTTTESTMADRLAALEAQADRLEATLRQIAEHMGVDLGDVLG